MATVCSNCRWIGTGRHENKICPNCSQSTEQVSDELAKSFFGSSPQATSSTSSSSNRRNPAAYQSEEKVDWADALQKGGTQIFKLGCIMYVLPLLILAIIFMFIVILSPFL